MSASQYDHMHQCMQSARRDDRRRMDQMIEVSNFDDYLCDSFISGNVLFYYDCEKNNLKKTFSISIGK